MLVTEATTSDIPALVHLVNMAYRGGEGWTDESHLLAGRRTDEAGVGELLKGSDSVILKYHESESALAGCVYLKRQENKLYLGMLSVWPARQGAGIGKALLSAAVDYARQKQCACIRITVISVRHELIAWYERHGYRRTGEIEPFHAGEKFGIQKQPLQLVVLERAVLTDHPTGVSGHRS